MKCKSAGSQELFKLLGDMIQLVVVPLSITCLNFRGKQVTTQPMVYYNNRVIRKVRRRQNQYPEFGHKHGEIFFKKT
jgi:hypothetical protein